jgi:hypothetical protein
VTPAGAQVSLCDPVARLVAALVAALKPRFDSIDASVAAVKLQQGLAGAQLASLGAANATLQTTLEGFMSTQASTEAQLQATEDAIASNLALLQTAWTNFLTADAAAKAALQQQITALEQQVANGSPVTQAQLDALNTEDAASNTALQAITAAIAAAANPAPPASQTAQVRKK